MRRHNVGLAIAEPPDAPGCKVYRVFLTQREQRVSDDVPTVVVKTDFDVRSCVTGALNADAVMASARRTWPDYVTVGLVGVTFEIEVEDLGACRHQDHK